MNRITSKVSAIGASIAIALVGFVLSACVLQAPPPAATPSAPQGVLSNTPGRLIVVADAAVTAVTNTTYASQRWADYATADIYVQSTGPGAAVTTTYLLQDSADGTNWFDRSYVITATASAAVYSRLNASGYWFRFKRLGTDTTSITSTIKVVLK